MTFFKINSYMKNKDTENQLVATQITWEIFDNLGDKIIEDAVEGVTSDILSSIPLGSIVIGAYKGFKYYKEKQRFKNFVVFLQSYKLKTKKEINQYLKDNPTSELGEYTLSMLEELASPRQTEMLGRATALLLNGVINEDTFFEYGYIIKRLDPHLFKLFNEVGEIYTNKVLYTYNSNQLEYLNLVVRDNNPLINGEHRYAYQISDLGTKFYERIIKGLKEE